MDYTEFKFDQEQIWLGGGVILTLLAGLSWFNVSSAISDFQMETAGNPFASAVSINAGSGLYLAVLVGILVIAVGWTLWQAPPHHFSFSNITTSAGYRVRPQRVVEVPIRTNQRQQR